MNERTPVPSAAPLAVDLAALKTLMDERDKRYQERFENQREALRLALDAQNKFHDSIFKMSQEAIAKAEDAQKEYNVRSNEFRGQLDDQAKTLMPRSESLGLHQAHRDRVDQVREESRLLMDGLRGELVTVQKTMSQIVGTKSGRSEFSTPLLMAIVSVVVGLAVFLIQRQLQDKPQVPAPAPVIQIVPVPTPASKS